MKAVIVEKYGDVDSLEIRQDVDVPATVEGTVLVRLHAAGVNNIEVRIRKNGWRGFVTPFTIGLDGAGVVEAVGEGVSSFKPGDRVYVFQPRTGTYADYCLADEEKVYKLHDRLSFEEGALLPTPYFTALRALKRANFEKGNSVLIQGASGAVGLAGIQIARGLGASKVFGTAGTERGLRLVKEMGADVAFNYKSPDFTTNLKEAVGPSGVDVIVETNADINLGMDIDILARYGHVAIIGKRGEARCVPHLLVAKECTVIGSSLFFSKTEERRVLHEVLYQGVEDGWLKPYIGGTFKFDDVRASHVDIEQRSGSTGKKVLLIN
ncbi:quinone oxidoreductase-like [Diadema antillarum]|uniref:quinone oxidoreductase-like n=1 Tax=Diadema antillarum TaxID=105358 RepID=UPI003A887CD4